MRRITTAAAGVAAVALASCGSSSVAAGSTSTSVHASSPSSPSSASSSTSVGPCRSSNLRAILTDAGDGAAATRYLTIQARNVGAAPCTTGGYFGVSSTDAHGQVIATHETHDTAQPAHHFMLSPGQSLVFTIGIGDLPVGPEGTCPRVGAFALVPPEDTSAVRLALLDAHGQGTQVIECPGAVVVRPVAPA